MTAMWKQTPLAQAQKRSPALDKEKQLAESRHEIKVLQAQLRAVLQEKEKMLETAGYYKQTADEYRKGHDRYEILRDQELMIMNKDGAKYLKGEELDKYVDGLQGSIREYRIQNLAKNYQQALAASMVQTKQVMAQQIFNNQYVLHSYPMSFTITEDDNGIDP